MMKSYKVAPREHILGEHECVVVSIEGLFLRFILFVEFMKVDRHSLQGMCSRHINVNLAH